MRLGLPIAVHRRLAASLALVVLAAGWASAAAAAPAGSAWGGVWETLAEGPARFAVELPGGRRATARLDDFTVSLDGFVWHGRAAGDELVVSGRRGRVAGTLFTDAGVFALLPGGAGWVAAAEGACEVAEPGSARVAGAAAGASAGAAASAATGPIDLLILYTPTTREVLKGRRNAETVIQHYVDVTNVAYRNSGIGVRVRLAHASEQTPPVGAIGSPERTFDWLRESPAVAALRDQHGADVVGVLYERPSGVCGSALMIYRPGRNDASQAVFQMQRACGAITFAHEVGHLQGADHDPVNARSGAVPGDPFPDARGHFHDGRYRTVMSYTTECTNSCPAQPFFSSPRRRFDRLRTGIPGERDNARVLDETAADIAAFRPQASGGCPLDPGDPDFCRECGPCAAGEGECAGDAECAEGLSCESGEGVSTCRRGDTCALAPGSPAYCTTCGPCSFGEGDCDRDTECAPGLSCLDDIGPQWGFAASTDVCAQDSRSYCPLPLGHPDYCKACGPCGEGEGGCGRSLECLTVLECVPEVGARFGFSPQTGVCRLRANNDCPYPPGHPDYCKACGLCAEGEGDCDGDRQCGRGLACVDGAGAAFGLPADADVCVPSDGGLAAPSGLTARLTPNGDVRLSWVDNSAGSAGFRVQARRAGDRFRRAGRAKRGVTEVVVGKLEPGTRYTFRVRAKRGKEKSAFSSEAAVTTPPD